MSTSHSERLLTSAELAAYLGVSVSYVYDHATELRARKLGSGPKARMRFNLRDVEARLIREPGDQSEKGERE